VADETPYFRTLCDDYASADGGTRRQIRGQFELRVPDPADPSRTLFSLPEQFMFDTGAAFSAVSEQFAVDYGFGDYRTAGTSTTVRGYDDSGPPRRGWLLPRWVRFRDHDLGPTPHGDGIPHLMFRVRFLVVEGATIEVPIFGLSDSHAYFSVGSIGEEYWFFLKATGDGVRPIS
jgi:hypothetical protein